MRDTQRERYYWEQVLGETSIDCLSHAPTWGPCLQPRHVPLPGNGTVDFSVHRPTLNPLSHTSHGPWFCCCYPHPRTCLLIFRERGREGEREGEKHCLPLIGPPTRDQTPNLCMCSDLESNLQPFGLQDDTPTNWATVARAVPDFLKLFLNSFRIASPDWAVLKVLWAPFKANLCFLQLTDISLEASD